VAVGLPVGRQLARVAALRCLFAISTVTMPLAGAVAGVHPEQIHPKVCYIRKPRSGAEGSRRVISRQPSPVRRLPRRSQPHPPRPPGRRVCICLPAASNAAAPGCTRRCPSKLLLLQHHGAASSDDRSRRMAAAEHVCGLPPSMAATLQICNEVYQHQGYLQLLLLLRRGQSRLRRRRQRGAPWRRRRQLLLQLQLVHAGRPVDGLYQPPAPRQKVLQQRRRGGSRPQLLLLSRRRRRRRRLPRERAADAGCWHGAGCRRRWWQGCRRCASAGIPCRCRGRCC
jgi:hypothetical protein